ncbi:MmgE/PrpD family protein [Acidiferrimicrobium sp. IK]|uniref:MmgE/PrpD family protein n=1 Tax=Acidiferrimicrobium sp. IK TaxID=2871700 RepID=UPI0021CB42DD|nr:MmgE/PrpD family protein [Acidiferrimicrobium sp. IK]MCU4186754.1 MmgE/PrpD family protein [Acidiferrimicrobium sp. IK]
MTGSEAARTGAAIDELGRFAVSLSWKDQGPDVRAALQRVLFDSIAVLIAGGRLPEAHRRRAALNFSTGPATAFGQVAPVAVCDAAWLNGCSLVALEMDEGNKRIRGHATAHVLPVALALAEAASTSGTAFVEAFLAGHEVASRFGQATVLHPGVHPHGNWGVAGAAAAAARLGGADARAMAAALDAAGALAIATPFDVALEGLPVRDAWIGQANVSGIRAWAVADATRSATGVAAASLGHLLGSIDPAALTAGLGEKMAITGGYLKRHASCSYTHPPADAVLALREQVDLGDGSDITEIVVETHHLAAGLDRYDWPSRLAAMFSVPYVVAAALAAGECPPEQFDDAHRADPARRALAARVRVVHAPELDQRLPAERVARLTVRREGGWERTVEMPNPVGDNDFRSLSAKDLRVKATSLLGGSEAADRVESLTADLITTDDVGVPLAELRRWAAGAAGTRLEKDTTCSA